MASTPHQAELKVMNFASVTTNCDHHKILAVSRRIVITGTKVEDSNDLIVDRLSD